MSRSSRLLAAAMLLALPAFACWEQIDDGQWFPQMKRQRAIQAFEINTLLAGHIQGLTPPEGAVAIGAGGDPDLSRLSFREQEVVQNPVPASLASLKRGEELYQRTCTTCHGPEGGGDGPVAGPPFGTGPLGLVLPIGGKTSVARGLSDGHIYTTMSIGRGRMPSYRRLSPEDRWNVVNYVRELNR